MVCRLALGKRPFILLILTQLIITGGLVVNTGHSPLSKWIVSPLFFPLYFLFIGWRRLLKPVNRVASIFTTTLGRRLWEMTQDSGPSSGAGKSGPGFDRKVTV